MTTFRAGARDRWCRWCGSAPTSGSPCATCTWLPAAPRGGLMTEALLARPTTAARRTSFGPGTAFRTDPDPGAGVDPTKGPSCSHGAGVRAELFRPPVERMIVDASRRWLGRVAAELARPSTSTRCLDTGRCRRLRPSRSGPHRRPDRRRVDQGNRPLPGLDLVLHERRRGPGTRGRSDREQRSLAASSSLLLARFKIQVLRLAMRVHALPQPGILGDGRPRPSLASRGQRPGHPSRCDNRVCRMVSFTYSSGRPRCVAAEHSMKRPTSGAWRVRRRADEFLRPDGRMRSRWPTGVGVEATGLPGPLRHGRTADDSQVRPVRWVAERCFFRREPNLRLPPDSIAAGTPCTSCRTTATWTCSSASTPQTRCSPPFSASSTSLPQWPLPLSQGELPSRPSPLAELARALIWSVSFRAAGCVPAANRRGVGIAVRHAILGQ